MRIFNKVALLAVAAAAMQSCDNPNLPDMLKSSGDQASVTITTGPAVSINVESCFGITLVKDNADYIVVTYGENLIESVHADYNAAAGSISLVDDTGSRIVRNNKSVPSAEIHYTSLQSITCNASVTISSADTVDVGSYVFNEYLGGLNILSNARKLQLVIADGAGKYQMAGRAENLDIEAHYTCVVDASRLSARDVTVRSYTTGEIEVAPYRSFAASIYWSGDVVYSGPVKADLKASEGRGDLIHRD